MDNNMNNSAYQQPAQYQQPQQAQYQPQPQPQPQPQQGQYQQGQYQQQPVNQFQTTNQYQPQMAGYQPELEEPVSIGDWVGSLLLFSLVPCVGLIICIVWAFSKDTKKSKANFCKAYLIIMLISIGLSILIGLIFGGMIAAAMSSVMYY